MFKHTRTRPNISYPLDTHYANVKVDFPLILFDLHVRYNKLSSNKFLKFPFARRPEIFIVAHLLWSLMYILC